MRTFIVILSLVLLAGYPKKQIEDLSNISIPEFPYQDYLDSLNKGNGSLIIKNDNGFSFISDKIAYLNPKEIAHRNTKIDSLADFYNAIIGMVDELPQSIAGTSAEKISEGVA